MLDPWFIVRCFAKFLWLARALCVLSVAIGILYLIDPFLPSDLSHQSSVHDLYHKEPKILWKKFESHYVSYDGGMSEESISKSTSQTLQIGDQLNATLTPIFHEWSSVIVSRDNAEVTRFQGNDAALSLTFAAFLFGTLACFLPKTIWENAGDSLIVLAVVAIIVLTHFVALITPLTLLKIHIFEKANEPYLRITPN